MLNCVPDGIAEPLITITSDPSASVDGRTTWPKLTDAPGVERQNVPTVTSAGMPCRARSARSSLGSSVAPRRRISVVVLPGPLVTENAARRAGLKLVLGGGLPERAGAGRERIDGTTGS